MCLWGRGSPPVHHSPSSFFPPLLTATEPCSPPTSLPLAFRTSSSSTPGSSSVGWECEARRETVEVLARVRYRWCRHNKRDRGETGGKKSPALLLPMHLLCLRLFLSPPLLHSNLWAAPVSSACLTKAESSTEAQGNSECLFIISKGNTMEK